MNTASLVLGLILAGCSHQAMPSGPPLTLTTLDGHSEPWQALVAHSRFTVLVFVSADCLCVQAHAARLNELATHYTQRGVQFLAVDSEAGTTVSVAAAEASKYRLQFPLVIDKRAQLANSLGALYATSAVILDRVGNIHYRGGLDSDVVNLHDNAKRYVLDALEDLLAGREPRLPQAKTLGCVLRKS
jgi:peroxiredoxin